MNPGGDSRAVSTTISYVLTLTITTLLVTGLLIAGGDFVRDQRSSATRSELRVVGQQLAADVGSADRLARTAGEGGDVGIERQLPDRVAGSPYRIGIRQVGSGDTYAFTMTSEDPEISTETRIYSTVPVFAKRNLTGGTAAIDYNSVTEEVLVRDPGPYVFQENGDKIVIEAESYPEDQPGSGEWSGHYWKTFEDPSASGGEALVTRPNVSTSGGTEDTTDGPRLDYEVNFEEANPYHVWVRIRAPPADSGNSNSVHAGLEGSLASTGGNGMGGSDSWEWVHTVEGSGSEVTVSPGSPGQSTFSIWMREDGTQIDKILLTTTDPSVYDPNSDPVPPESEWG